RRGSGGQSGRRCRGGRHCPGRGGKQVMGVRSRTALLLVMISALAVAQTAADRVPQIQQRGSPYRARRVSPVSFQNSSRIGDLIRAGHLYLSLSDAIALAIENNLDVQLERYLPKIAATEVQ